MRSRRSITSAACAFRTISNTRRRAFEVDTVGEPGSARTTGGNNAIPRTASAKLPLHKLSVIDSASRLSNADVRLRDSQSASKTSLASLGGFGFAFALARRRRLRSVFDMARAPTG